MIESIKNSLERAAGYAAQYMDDDPEMLLVGLDILLKISQIHKNLEVNPGDEAFLVSADIKQKSNTELSKLAKSGTTSRL